jgi:nucleotide-binding universal stress UspA family protein
MQNRVLTKYQILLFFKAYSESFFIINIFLREEVNMSIMVAYDGSEVAKDALRLAREHARVFNEDIEVVQVAENGDDLNYSKIDNLERNLEKEVNKLLNGDDTAYKTTLLVGSGTAGEQILYQLDTKESKSIYMGVRRRSKMGKLLFGSTAQYVILNASCPVVTTR